MNSSTILRQCRWLTAMVLLSAGPATASLALVPEGTAGYELTSREHPMLSLSLHAWGENWRWFVFPDSARASEPGFRAVDTRSEVPDTGVSVSLTHRGRAVTHDDNKEAGGRVEMHYQLRSERDVAITCAVLALEADPAVCPDLRVHRPDGAAEAYPGSQFGPAVSGPTLALTYECVGGRTIRVKLPEPVHLSNHGAELRLQLAADRLEASRSYDLALELHTSETLTFFSRAEDASRAPDRTNWFDYPIARLGLPVDLSFMNQDSEGNYIPAGSRGFLRVDDGRLVFEDGTEGRFWGVNLTAGATLPEAARAIELADRLARLGINAVRLHHLDSWYRPIIDYSHPSGTTRHLDAESMRRLDRLVYELRRRGIYIVLDPWVQRRFLPGDGVPATEDMGEGSFHLHPYIFFDERMQELHREFLKAFWTHRNEYTGLRYVDDPAIIFTGLANEALMQRGRGHVRLEPYRSNFITRYRRWAIRNGVVPMPGDGVIERNWPRNHQRFYIDLMREFYGDMAEFMRNELGFRPPINASNWFLWHWEIVSQQAMDLMDAHFYYDGDRIGPGAELGGSWLEHPPGRPDGPFGTLGAMRVTGKPLVITEVAQSPPKTYRSAYLPGLAAVAALQDWSGVFAYAFSQSARPRDVISEFELEADPLSLAGLAAGALIYRRADVTPARENVVVVVDDDHLFDLHHSERRGEAFEHSAAFNRLLETRKVSVCFEYSQDCEALAGARSIRTGELEAIRDDSSEITSDGETLWRDWARGLGKIDSARTQAVYGRLAAEGPLQTQDIEFTTDTPHVTIVVSSLDGRAIPDAGDLLLLAMGRAENSAVRTNFRGDRIVNRGQAPVIVEPVFGEVRVRTGAVAAEIVPLLADGTYGEKHRLPVQNGTLKVAIDGAAKTLAWRIRLTHADGSQTIAPAP